MTRSKKWYKNADYKRPMERTKLGDGSEVWVDPAYDNAEQLIICRKWPNGNEEWHRIVPPQGPHGETKYLSHGNSFQQLEEGANPDPGKTVHSRVNPVVPGNKVGDNYDEATGLYFKHRDAIEKHYKDNHLARLTRSDMKNFKMGSQPEGLSQYSKFSQFSVTSEGSAPTAPAGNEVPTG